MTNLIFVHHLIFSYSTIYLQQITSVQIKCHPYTDVTSVWPRYNNTARTHTIECVELLR